MKVFNVDIYNSAKNSNSKIKYSQSTKQLAGFNKGKNHNYYTKQ
jgi:hypothetical protein